MLVLSRLVENATGTYGVFIYERKIICYSLELPWLGNVQNKSCIPFGQYDVVKANSPRLGQVFYVKDVPGRSSILIHPGNTLKDTDGCILPGSSVFDGGVSRSRDALDDLYSALPSNFKLNIRKG
jgi:hypothetical protein